MMPDAEGFKDGQKFFVMSIIVRFCRAECAGMKGNWVYFTIIGNDRKNCHQGIVGGISLYNDLSIGDPVSKDWGCCESNLKVVKG